MAKCRCGSKPRIVSNVVQSLNNSGNCVDVCASPITGESDMLGIMTPLIYDEIGINLCTTFDLDTDISTTYPTATKATIQVINATYGYSTSDVQVEIMTGRQNCYLVTLSNITLQFAMNLYDSSCRWLGTIYPTALYLPSDITSDTYDADTNPSSVELEIFAPYGLSYDLTTQTPTPVINYIGFSSDNYTIKQGINLFGMAKLLEFSTENNTATVGVTLVLQSLYYAGYKVKSCGKIDIPKGSIVTPENSDCLRFVAGDLLNLAIKPLDLGGCNKKECGTCSGCNGCSNCNGTVSSSDAVLITPEEANTVTE